MYEQQDNKREGFYMKSKLLLISLFCVMKSTTLHGKINSIKTLNLSTKKIMLAYLKQNGQYTFDSWRFANGGAWLGHEEGTVISADDIGNNKKRLVYATKPYQVERTADNFFIEERIAKKFDLDEFTRCELHEKGKDAWVVCECTLDANNEAARKIMNEAALEYNK
jgi:hypothetical protein